MFKQSQKTPHRQRNQQHQKSLYQLCFLLVHLPKAYMNKCSMFITRTSCNTNSCAQFMVESILSCHTQHGRMFQLKMMKTINRQSQHSYKSFPKISYTKARNIEVPQSFLLPCCECFKQDFYHIHWFIQNSKVSKLLNMNQRSFSKIYPQHFSGMTFFSSNLASLILING